MVKLQGMMMVKRVVVTTKLTWMPELQDTEQAPHSAHPDQRQLVFDEAQVTFTCRQIIIMMSKRKRKMMFRHRDTRGKSFSSNNHNG